MTQYPAVLDQQFGQALKNIKSRISVLENRTNAIGTNADGSVTVSNLFVVNGTGLASIVPDPTLSYAPTASPALEFSDGLGSSATPFLLYSAEIQTGGGQPYEFGSMHGPSSLADSAASLVEAVLYAGGTGANAAHGALYWENNHPLSVQSVLWDQWGVTLSQPMSGSLASLGTIVTGSALQNDQPPGTGSLPKFFHPSGYSGNSNAAGEITFNHGCTFTPQGMIVIPNAPGIANNLTIGIESNVFNATTATFSVKFANTNTAYASAFLTFYALLWG